MSSETRNEFCSHCQGKGCEECGYEQVEFILHRNGLPSDYEPYCDDNDDEDWYGPDYENWQGDSYADYPVDVRPTLRGRLFTLRWFTIPDLFASLKWKFWYARWRMKHKVNRLLHREEYDEIPF